MNQRARNIVIFVLLIIFGLVAWQAFRHREPVYQGRKLSGWLAEARTFDNPQVEEALRAMGASAIPSLLNMLRVKDSPLRDRLRELAGQQGWMALHFEPAEEVQNQAMYGFEHLGPAAPYAVPGLIRLLDDENPRARASAAWCLSTIRPARQETIAALVKYLNAALSRKTGSKDDELERYVAARALGEMGPAASAAIPQLVVLTAATNDFHGFASAAAQTALILIRREPIQPLIDSLKDTSNQTNWLKTYVLMDFLGTNAEPAVPVLVAALSQTNIAIQNRAIHLLENIHSRPELCISAITPFLQSTSTWTRADSLSAMRAFGTNAKPWAPMPEIIRHLSDPDQWVRQQATNALRVIDPEAAAKAGVK